VFHLAAYEQQKGTSFNPHLDKEVNVSSVRFLLEVCVQRHLSPLVVFASTSNSVGAPEKQPVNESFPDEPLTTFAKSKLSAEHHLRSYTADFRIPTIILRLANVYGPSSNIPVTKRGVLNLMMLKAIQGEPLSLFANQSCIRDFVYIDDVVSAFLTAGKSRTFAKGQRYLIGSGESVSIRSAVDMIVKKVSRLTGVTPRIRFNLEEKLNAVELRNFTADTTQFQSATGWTSRTSLSEGMDKTLYWMMQRLALSEVS